MFRTLDDCRAILGAVTKGASAVVLGGGLLGLEAALASTQNAHVLQHARLQDTNDRFLANIQRRGLYSVVPRSGPSAGGRPGVFCEATHAG